MQPGFAMLEAGLIRAKNVGNIIMKNVMDLSLGSLFYWIIGFGIMFGASSSGLIGSPDLFLFGGLLDNAAPDGVSPWAFFIFQTVFCATSATIVSGAVSERTKFSAYCVYAVVLSAIVYPISGHWIWGGGWLAQLGFHDFAGSTAVHLVGGVAGLVGAAMVGPRIGKYSSTGESRAIPGHSLSLAALGVFILWFGWFGFNGASTVSASGDDVLAAMGSIITNTNLAASAGAAMVMIITWALYKKPDVSMTLNGALAGLVGITAGCDATNAVGAVLTGLISGVAVVASIAFIDKKLKVDDPVGAIGVHGVCGAVGTLCVGLFAIDGGLFFGGGLSLLGTQALGVVSVTVWVAVTMFILFRVTKSVTGIRVSKAEEIEGLDIHEHGLASSYADFMPVPTGDDSTAPAPAPAVSKDVAVPVADVRERKPAVQTPDGKPKMTKISIITRQSMFEPLEKALTAIGITGLTVTNLLGYGMQKGHTEYYRGVPVQARLLPKIRVEIVVCKIPVPVVIEAAKNSLYTGNYGDGKIFVYDVENVIRVRTGEEGFDALQDD
jgi:Amt family ammonium transporter